jgi:hypothetical protein
MQPLIDPELIEKLKRDFPSVVCTNLTCVYRDNQYVCYKDLQSGIKYLFDNITDKWMQEDTEYWRTVPIS